jgi:DNA polymerase-3 subunit delta
MKIPPRNIENFIKKPDPSARIILIYGPDSGLVKERAKTIGLTIVSDLNDPFNTAKFTASQLLEDSARLNDEANAISMMGGDRLIRIDDSSDKLTPLIKDYLDNPSQNCLILLEASDLGPRSTLRKLCESHDKAAALPCYVEDERGMARVINEKLAAEGKTIERDAQAWLANHISGDRGRANSEIEKLIIYKGHETGAISLRDVMDICGSAGASSLDELVNATASGHAAQAIRHFEKLSEEGVAFIAILRTLQNHLKRLHEARSAIEKGASAETAMKKLSPPVFFKYQPAFQSQLRQWPLKKINTALNKLMEIEADCKKTGTPAHTLCSQAVLGLSKMAN